MNGQTSFDVVISGGGMVGSMLAAALGNSRLQVAVIESSEPQPFHSSDAMDLRVSALSLATENMLRATGAWAGIQKRRSCAFRHMHVTDGEQQQETHFFSGDLGETHLGTIVENRVLQLALVDSLRAHENVTWICPARLETFDVQESSVAVRLQDGSTLDTKVIVGADGARSRVREIAGISTDTSTYPQHALVASCTTSFEQQAITWQRFMPTGPQAFLPMPGQNASMVWYHSEHEIERLKGLSSADFLDEMMAAFPTMPGTLESVEARGSFPLSCSHARHYVKPRVALIGDAAHTVHPLAGQGVNLGMLDAGALAETLLEASKGRHDVGAYRRLRPYERWRRFDNSVMMTALDGFYHAFKPQPHPVRVARALAMKLANDLTPLNRIITQYAMGTVGDIPALARAGSV